MVMAMVMVVGQLGQLGQSGWGTPTSLAKQGSVTPGVSSRLLPSLSIHCIV